MRSLILALFVIAFVGTATANLLASLAQHALARRTQIANTYATIALADGERTLRTTIAAQITSGALDGPFQAPPTASPAPLCPQSTGTCTYLGSTDILLDGATAALDTQGASDTAYNVQGADGVHEHRLAARLHVVVTTPDGSVLAEKTRDVTVRTFGAAPYVAVTGTSDASATTVADSAGCTATDTACAPQAAASLADTQLHTIQHCQDAPLLAGMCGGERIGDVDTTRAAATNHAWTNGTNAGDGWHR